MTIKELLSKKGNFSVTVLSTSDCIAYTYTLYSGDIDHESQDQRGYLRTAHVDKIYSCHMSTTCHTLTRLCNHQTRLFLT